MRELSEETKRRIATLRLQADWEESGRTFQIEFKSRSFDTGWEVVKNPEPEWSDALEYRRKPEPQFVPWTFEDAETILGLKIRGKAAGHNCAAIITGANDVRLYVGNASGTYDEFFKMWEQLDGTPCGKEKP